MIDEKGTLEEAEVWTWAKLTTHVVVTKPKQTTKTNVRFLDMRDLARWIGRNGRHHRDHGRRDERGQGQ